MLKKLLTFAFITVMVSQVTVCAETNLESQVSVQVDDVVAEIQVALASAEAAGVPQDEVITTILESVNLDVDAMTHLSATQKKEAFVLVAGIVLGVVGGIVVPMVYQAVEKKFAPVTH